MLTGADKVVYTTPTRQWPTGVAMSAERRRELLEWSARAGGVIIKNDLNAEFTYGHAYWDEHEDIGVGADARGPAFFVVEPKRNGRLWEVRQIIDDPAGNRDWSIFATVDLDACDEAGELVLRTLDFSRLDG